MAKPIDFHRIKRVLVAKLRHHGDVLLTSPLFSYLKTTFPHLEIDAYIYRETLPILEGHSAISDYILYDKEWKKLPVHRRLLKEFALLRAIKKRGYDLVINLTEGDRGAIAAGVSRARYAIGFDPEGQGMKGKEKCYTHVIKHTPKPRHTVEKQLDALRCLGFFPLENERNLSFHIPTDANERVEGILNSHDFKKGEYVLIHPVSRWMFKTLPPKTIAEVIQFLHRQGKKVILTGSQEPAELKMNQEICALVPSIPILDLSGKIHLKELGALIKECALLISVDSLPLHLSSVFKTPVVAIFGPTCDQNWGPYQNPKSRVVTLPVSCRPCYRPGCAGSGKSDCLLTLPASKIIKAIEELIT